MENSATNDGGLRERKRAQTRAAISAVARSLTAQRGLNGFTVEEACEQAGISRRTFFNYFHTKEDAVIGSFSDELPEDALEAFNRNPARALGTISATISDSLLSALRHFTLAVLERSTVSPSEIRQLIAAVTAEPQLLARLTREGEVRERQFAELIATREGLPADHVEVTMAAAVFGAVTKKTSKQFFSEENTEPYRELLDRNLNAARALFAQPLDANPVEPQKDQP
ncbi:TetR/AcrR family transcriptional regulator [Arthrobacter sp. B2a2-09]|uniref:TetR/AcrR family transcriptional regulator n=1 Tax=Arthrobacter sp. B2a2-09 TaxID=2952822 RepID=UPI0022CD9D9B|nr:TetR/AcrR family transcriptional regulator [Arthrobacter sp. B2a2-09]MCZ9881368.1 TetR/AcrR family transcriptional regulator [Arthrobacter sp. B2a2-09]